MGFKYRPPGVYVIEKHENISIGVKVPTEQELFEYLTANHSNSEVSNNKWQLSVEDIITIIENTVTTTENDSTTQWKKL